MLRLLLGSLNAPLDLAHVVEVLVELRAVAGAKSRSRVLRSPATKSSRLRSVRIRARRSSAVLPPPNIRSNTTRGLISIGSGVVGVCQLSVFMYAQL